MSRLIAWLKSWLFEVPPEIKRSAVDPHDVLARARKRKREELNRAYRTGDVETVKRLTRELSGR